MLTSAGTFKNIFFTKSQVLLTANYMRIFGSKIYPYWSWIIRGLFLWGDTV